MHGVEQTRREQKITIEFRDVEFTGELGETAEWSGEVKIWLHWGQEKVGREVLERIVIHKSFLHRTLLLK